MSTGRSSLSQGFIRTCHQNTPMPKYLINEFVGPTTCNKITAEINYHYLWWNLLIVKFIMNWVHQIFLLGIKKIRYFHLVRKLLWLRFLRIGFVLPVFEGNNDILKIIKEANSEVLIFRCLLSLLVRNDTAEFEVLMTIYFEDITKNISPDNWGNHQTNFIAQYLYERKIFK